MAGINVPAPAEDENQQPVVNTPTTSDTSRERTRKRWVEELEGKIRFRNPELQQIIEDKVEDPENFLGFGGAAAVFNVGHQCVKLVRNRWKKDAKREMYNLGRHPVDEFRIQNMLDNFEHNGVRTPRVFRCDYSASNDFAAIFMERLDAIELTDIIRGIEPPPANFNPEAFVEQLEEFIYQMHDDLNIIHGDLAPRNVMVDRKTGQPRVIDFGRAMYYSSKPEDFDARAQVDEHGIDSIESALQNMNQ